MKHMNPAHVAADVGIRKEKGARINSNEAEKLASGNENTSQGYRPLVWAR